MKTVPGSKINEFKNPSKLPTLKKGDTAIFRLTGIQEDPKNPGKLLCPNRKIRARDFIIDPTIEDGDVVEIALIKTVKPNGQADLDTIWFWRDARGMITLNGSKPRDRDMYTYLMLSNANASNEEADGSLVKVFELVDSNAKAISDRKRRTLMTSALRVAQEMSVKEIQEFVSASGQSSKQPEDILRDIVESMAEKAPQDFLNTEKSDDRPLKATIKSAVDGGLVTFDKRSRTFKYVSTGDVVCKIARQGDILDGYVAFVRSTPNGTKVHNQLSTRLENHLEEGVEDTTDSNTKETAED